MLAISFGFTDELGNAIYGFRPGQLRRLFDPLYIPVLLRSVAYAFATAALCLLIGYPIAYYIARFGGRYKYLLIALLVIPFFVNYLIRIYAWVAILSDEGLVNGLLVDLGLTRRHPVPQHPVRGDRRPRLWLHGVHDPAHLRRARPHGPVADRGRQRPLRDARQTFRHVTWPATFQGVLAGAVLVFLPAVGDFISAQLLGGPDTYMVGNLIQQQFFEANNFPFGAALTTVLMAFLSIFMVFYLRSAATGGGGGASVERRPAPACSSRPRRRPAREAKPSTGRGSCDVLLRAFLLWTFAPIAIVVLFSFNSGKSLQNFQGFCTSGTATSSATSRCASPCSSRLEIALVTMVVATLLGIAARLRPRPLAQPPQPGDERHDADPAGRPRDRRRSLGAAAVHPDRHAAFVLNHHPRPHHVLDLLRDGDRARTPRRPQPRGRRGGDGPRSDPFSDPATASSCRRSGRPSWPPAC